MRLTTFLGIAAGMQLLFLALGGWPMFLLATAPTRTGTPVTEQVIS